MNRAVLESIAPFLLIATALSTGSADAADSSSVAIVPAAAPAIAPIAATDSPLPSSSASALPAPSSESERSTRLDLLTRVRGRFLEDTKVRSDTFGTLLSLDGSHRFSPELSAEVNLIGLFSSGAASNLVTDEGTPSNGIGLALASLNYTPWKPLLLQAGVLDSSLFMPSFAGDGCSFPGLAQTVSVGGDELKGSLTLREMIPTSGAASTRQLDGSDPVPTMLMNTFALESRPAQPLFLQGSLTYYSFSNLAQGMAMDSRVYGNTLIGISRGVNFAYGFEGLEARMSFELNRRKKDAWNVHAEGATIWNSQAPDGSNRGYQASLGGTYLFSPFRVSADLMYFLNQSDTVPATYSNSNTGYNNRQGPGAQLKFDLTRIPVTFFGSYFLMNEIQANPYQADRSIVQVGAETKYAIF